METFLAPIENPNSLGMKLAYFFTKKYFGKVLMPLKVHSARLPTAFGKFYAKISQLDKKLVLPEEMVLLIRQHVAQLNICLFCIDISRATAIQASMNEEKINELVNYRSSLLFSEREKAALDYATELTKDKQVNPGTFKKLAYYFSEREICEIVYLVASEHVYNLTNIGLNIHSDMLCDITKLKK
ncbi:carboxymuconolactone decarboxylase family protein [Rhodocytophaga rosea]|uniref:Carboxymuconolactone decarboxylase family protein n=1 Tax=Rhodocytophaga rosea TaxID=2704465 RepID=A0A6C0GMD7_9BACT|nr:carboxymuconolactone decarboxylase family protein [Rhodocytophaga rosea]QHT69231.1 carboxymuconolactone decarboxylase family protein [Rhodocytophaga rosea]